MKKTKRLFSLILSGAMLASSAVFTVNAQTTAPQYDIDFVYDAETEVATAAISVSGGTFAMGRFGFSYDPAVLTLLNADGEVYDESADMMADVVIGHEETDEYTVIATEETNYVSDLIDTNAGTILFAWYTNLRIQDGEDLGFVVATEGAKTLVTVNFALADDIADMENPADALDALEDSFIGAFDGDVDDINGWDDVYSIREDSGKEIVSDKDDIAVETAITPDISGLKITAGASGRNINVSWTPLDKDETGVASYKVEILDADGNVVASTDVDVVEDEKCTAKFTKDEGIKYNTKYVVKVTPVTESGKLGVPATKNVKTDAATGAGGSSTTEGDGTSLTYTVTYHAGEGTIPEGQKFKYTVAMNGYVSGSPEVIAPEGKIFAGWSVDGVTLVSIEVYKIKKNTTFKAIYVESEKETHRPFILGYPGGIVKADAALTRAEAAAIIARASATFDENKTYTADFSDVPADHWAANYIAFVYENNIVTGYEDHTYHPSSNITRAEFATIMQRYLGIELNEDANFSDVSKDHWAVAYIGACKFAGLINGYENGEFRPSNEITRAEAVKILNRATDRAPTPTAIDSYVDEKGIPFEDLDSSKWYFYEIMEAAFPHLISYYH